MFNKKHEESTYTIKVCVRNSLGEITGTKTYSTDSAASLAYWFDKNGSTNIVKKNKTPKPKAG
jgi:hypothetical protein